MPLHLVGWRPRYDRIGLPDDAGVHIHRSEAAPCINNCREKNSSVFEPRRKFYF